MLLNWRSTHLLLGVTSLKFHPSPNVGQFQSISNDSGLYVEVKVRVSPKTRRPIDLQHPRLESVVEKNVESENLEKLALPIWQMAVAGDSTGVEYMRISQN